MAAMQALPVSALKSRPMGEMNTTPLIDVMLVLLIMFIMTVPISTNSLPVDLPQSGHVTKPNPVRNSLRITPAGAILWNDAPVSKAQLSALLERTRQMPIEPQLQFDPDGQASYALAAEVTQLISLSGVTNYGFVGAERYGRFDRAVNSASPAGY